MTGISIIKYVRAILTEDKILMDMIGGEDKIKPLVAENDVNTPFIIIRKDSISPAYNKDGVEDTVTVAIQIVTQNYFENVDIAERIRLLLENKRTEYIKQMRMNNLTEDYVSDMYVEEFSFSAIIK